MWNTLYCAESVLGQASAEKSPLGRWQVLYYYSWTRVRCAQVQLPQLEGLLSNRFHSCPVCANMREQMKWNSFNNTRWLFLVDYYLFINKRERFSRRIIIVNEYLLFVLLVIVLLKRLERHFNSLSNEHIAKPKTI